MRPDGVTDLGRVRTLGFADRFDDDVRRRQRASFFGQAPTEGLHELIVDLLAAVFGQQASHLRDVLFLAATLFRALLQHGGAAGRSTLLTERSTRSWRAHARARRAPSRRPCWSRSARRTRWSIASRRTRDRRRELGIELAPTTTATTRTRSTAARPSALAPDLLTAVFTARRSSAITIKAISVQIVRFEVAVNTFAAWARSTPPGSRLNHHQWRFVFLGNLRRRQPSLLQRGKLAEQRFLQRPTHTHSLRPVKFVAVSAQPSTTVAAPQRAMPDTLTSIKGVKCAREPIPGPVTPAAV